ncbi:capsule biosynthesis GfcC family protein [Photobacterium nomapromontoriensis]|uniref:capsule biosynthesis GfcC family protein n=1 Tax=Photobacterium nomapromontoriensis TaxID=2910237 RepID=UPI003D0E3BF4
MNSTHAAGVQPHQTLFRKTLSPLLTFARSSCYCLLGANLFVSSLTFAVTTSTPPVVTANAPVVVTTTYSMANTTNATSQTPALRLTYPSAVRMEQVLTDSIGHLSQLPVSANIHNQPIYWLGAGLYRHVPHPDKAAVLTSLEQLSSQLSADQSSSHAHDIAVIQALQQTLSALTIGERIFTPLDYDMVRITPSANPLISQSVTLVLPPRPTDIIVLGAVEKPGAQPWLPRQATDFYLSQAQPSSQGITQAANSYATVIQPDGHVESHPIAYWNQNHLDIAPGATVYLNFADLPRQFATLNDEIITLLRNRAL